jgi:hypothetical protein
LLVPGRLGTWCLVRCSAEARTLTH